MIGILQNSLGKIEKNKKIKEGDCIFPFKYKYNTYDKCFDTKKGKICATSLSERGTLKTYGYCKGKKRKTLKKKKKLKLIIVDSSDKTTTMSTMMEPSKPKPPYNDSFIALLGKLEQLMNKKGEPMRGRAYQKAQQSLIMYDNPITDVNQVSDLKGIGKTILSKFQEYIDTGKLQAIEKEKKNPLLLFTNIYGVGPKKAHELIKTGITTISQLRKHPKELNDKQKLGLQYYEDIEKRIPRSEIDEFSKALSKIFIQLKDSNASMEVVGSYRRGAKDSGDIDIIITDKSSNGDLLGIFVKKLIDEGIILHKLTNGKTKILCIAQLPGKSIARRVDFLYTPPNEYPFALLYFTGSKIFNTVMRQRALDMGYTLNEHGFYRMVSGKKGAKVQDDFPTEKSIFTFLNMEYKDPIERKDARAVQTIKDPSISLSTPVPAIGTVCVKGVKKTVKKKLVSSITQMREFTKKGIGLLDILSEKQLKDLLTKANDLYYNKPEKVVLSDEQFDIIKDYFANRYPDHPFLKLVGAPIIGKKDKVVLPFPMPSMDKIKPQTGALTKWVTKYNKPSSYILSAKLDGTSGLYTTTQGVAKLYTRGDGLIGKDITHLIPFLNLPNLLTHPDIAVRGEFVISKEKFVKHFKSKGGKNARNTVAGLINTLIGSDDHKFIDFVGYEIIMPDMTPQKQMAFIEKTLKMHTVNNRITSSLSNEQLSELLVDWRTNYKYEIDGIIVTHNKVYSERKNKNPEHAFAFKMVLSDQVAEAKVVNVLWSPSKDGYLKPRVQIEPIELGGVTITYATGKNAAFIEKHKIGIGSVIELVRSGDVIPDIKNVVIPANEPSMPDVEYMWNDTHVDIMLVDKSADETVREKNILGFFKALEVEGLGPGVVKKIINAGFTTIPAILRMTEDDFLDLDGFKKTMAKKIYTNIDKGVKNANLALLMKASNIFGRGFGERKLQPVLKKYPTILIDKESESEKVAKLLLVDGWSTKSSTEFVKHVDAFVAFLKECGLVHKLTEISFTKEKEMDTTHPLYGEKIVFSGFRPKELMEKIQAKGGEIGLSVSKKTFAVIVKTMDEDTGKAEQARAFGVSVMTPNAFITLYNL